MRTGHVIEIFKEDRSNMKHEKITSENVIEKYEYIFADWVKELNIEFCEVRERYVRAKFKNKAKFRFFSGAVCGQVLMAVVDTVMSVAMGTTETPVRGTLSNAKSKDLLSYRSEWPLEKGYQQYISWYKDFFNKKINVN